MSHYCRFNAQEDAEIIKMRKAGAKFRDIGIALKRHPNSVSRRYHGYLSGRHAEEPTWKVLTWTSRVPWSESELEILRSAIDTSRYHPKLALLLPGRSKVSIREKLNDEKLLRWKANGVRRMNMVRRIRHVAQGPARTKLDNFQSCSFSLDRIVGLRRGGIKPSSSICRSFARAMHTRLCTKCTVDRRKSARGILQWPM